MTAGQYFLFQRSVERLINEYGAELQFQWGDPLDHMRRMPFNAKLGYPTHIMEIKTNGDLAFTSYLPVSAGNCRNGTLREYWDAGYDRIWSDKRFLQYTEQIRDIYDLEEFEPQPYTGKTILIDILGEKA